MQTHCRHETKNCSLPIDTARYQNKNQQASFGGITTQNDGYTHVIDQSYAPEKHFEPWNLSDVPKNRKSSPNSKKLNETTCIDPSNAPYFSRSYGWNEIDQTEEDEKRLRQLLTIWDAERIAILKLQHDLDKNVFKRTFDYVKRIGQSIGLALWLWVHRPANCSNISSLYQHHPSISPIMTTCNSENLLCSPYTDTRTYHFPENEEDQGRQQQFSLSPLDALPDSMWLKHFVLDESQESLPPIARAMKNMLDNNMLVWNSEIRDESAWPHFINQYRITQNKTFLRNLYGNSGHQAPLTQKPASSSQYASDKRKANMKMTDTRVDRRPSEKSNTSMQHERIPSSIYRADNPSEKQQHNILDIPQPKDSQSLTLSSEKDNGKSRKHQQKLKKKGQSKSKDKKIKASKGSRRSKSKGRKSRSRSKSKRRNTRSRSNSKSRRSPHRSKSKGRKSSRRSKSKKKKKRITARTIK